MAREPQETIGRVGSIYHQHPQLPSPSPLATSTSISQLLPESPPGTSHSPSAYASHFYHLQVLLWAMRDYPQLESSPLYTSPIPISSRLIGFFSLVRLGIAITPHEFSPQHQGHTFLVTDRLVMNCLPAFLVLWPQTEHMPCAHIGA